MTIRDIVIRHWCFPVNFAEYLGRNVLIEYFQLMFLSNVEKLILQSHLDKLLQIYKS